MARPTPQQLARRAIRKADHHLTPRLPRAAQDRIARAKLEREYANELVPAAAIEESFLHARRDVGYEGVYAEFGVCHGTSMIAMTNAMRRSGVVGRMVGFDSFEGLPPEAEGDDGGAWEAGQFDSDEAFTRERIAAAGADMSRTHLEVGWFSDTLTAETAARLDLVGNVTIAMVDCDIYLATVEVLEFLHLTLADDAIVFFDDWNSADLAEKNLGEKKAFDEFLAARPEYRAVELPNLVYAPNANVFRVTRAAEQSGAASGA